MRFCLLAALILTTVPTWARDDIHSLARKCDSQRKQKACEKLADLAEHSKDPAVRIRALSVTKDQTVLARIAVEDKDPSVRSGAVRKLTDQILLAKIAVEDRNFEVGSGAVGKLTDHALLAKIAVEGKNPYVRSSAVGKLTDGGLLAKIAVEDEDAGVRGAAVGVLTDQPLLAKVAGEDKDTGVRLAAIARVTDHAVLVKIAGDRRRTADSAVEAAARICLALQDPVVVARMPDAKLATDYSLTHQTYSRPNFIDGKVAWTQPDVTGENIIFIIKQGSRTLARRGWETQFPIQVPDPTKFIPAIGDVLTLMSELFSQPEFTQQDLLGLAQSNVPEVRVGALANSQDQAVLAKLALGFTGGTFSETLVSKLTDQALLAQIGLKHPDFKVRQAAVRKLTDQTVLAKVAMSDNSVWVRQAAVNGLTDQALLAKIAMKEGRRTDETGEVFHIGASAVAKLTDQALLSKVAAEGDDSEVRQAAAKRLADLAHTGLKDPALP